MGLAVEQLDRNWGGNLFMQYPALLNMLSLEKKEQVTISVSFSVQTHSHS